jgi:fluoroacetyl-CoA thioesterase
MKPELQPGLKHRFTYTVRADKTVPHLYPEFEEFREMPDVFATGYLVGLMEGACLMAIKPYLDWPLEQSLGTHVNFSHLAATMPGMMITVDCELIEVDGRRLKFHARAHDGYELISEGTHERVVIDVERFRRGLARKVGGQAA